MYGQTGRQVSSYSDSKLLDDRVLEDAHPVPSFQWSQAQRRCTDIPCLIVFFAFLVGLWTISAQAREVGNLAKLTHGFDWAGNICGVDEAVVNKSMLFWCSSVDDGSVTLTGICVEECPRGSTTSSMCPGKPEPFEQDYRLAEGRTEVLIGLTRNLTAQPDYPSTGAFGYCFPKEDIALLQRVLGDTHVSTIAEQLVLAGHGAVESWRFLVMVAIASVAIGYLFLFVLWSCFDKLLYALVLAAHLLLLAATAALLYGGFHLDHNFFVNYMEPWGARCCAWGCAAVSLTAWILYMILCCYSREALAVTVESVQATCEVLTHIPTILLQPLIHSLVVMGTLLSLIYGFAWLLSAGKVVPDGEPLIQGGFQISGVHRTLVFTPAQWGFLAYWGFGFVWILETVNALGQFAISHAVVRFAVFDEVECCPMLHGYWNGLTRHLGTLAYGGFIIGCLKILAAVISFIVRQAQAQGDAEGAVVQCICCCCLQLALCLEQVLAMVNDLVYTDVALRSTSYSTAASNVVQIAKTNPLTYASIKGSATSVRFLGVTVIGGIGTFLSYQTLASTALHQDLQDIFEGVSSMLATSSILGTTAAAGLICFYTAIAFMMVFYQTTYSLMYCTLIGALSFGQAPETAPRLTRKWTICSDASEPYDEEGAESFSERQDSTPFDDVHERGKAERSFLWSLGT